MNNQKTESFDSEFVYIISGKGTEEHECVKNGQVCLAQAKNNTEYRAEGIIRIGICIFRLAGYTETIMKFSMAVSMKSV